MIAIIISSKKEGISQIWKLLDKLQDKNCLNSYKAYIKYVYFGKFYAFHEEVVSL